jgi:hypothetical protein
MCNTGMGCLADKTCAPFASIPLPNFVWVAPTSMPSLSPTPPTTWAPSTSPAVVASNAPVFRRPSAGSTACAAPWAWIGLLAAVFALVARG